MLNHTAHTYTVRYDSSRPASVSKCWQVYRVQSRIANYVARHCVLHCCYTHWHIQTDLVAYNAAYFYNIPRHRYLLLSPCGDAVKVFAYLQKHLSAMNKWDPEEDGHFIAFATDAPGKQVNRV